MGAYKRPNSAFVPPAAVAAIKAQSDEPTPDFDLEKPLEFATRVIDQQRQLFGWPVELSKMSPQQLKEEKAFVKKQLRNFDLAFQAKTGQLVRDFA